MAATRANLLILVRPEIAPAIGAGTQCACVSLDVGDGASGGQVGHKSSSHSGAVFGSKMSEIIASRINAMTLSINLFPCRYLPAVVFALGAAFWDFSAA